MTSEEPTFGDWLRSARGRRKRTDVAREIGFSNQFVSDVELGRRNPNIILAIRAARFFDYNPWTVLGTYNIMPKEDLEYLADTLADLIG